MAYKYVEVEDGVFKKVPIQKRNKLAVAARQRWKGFRKEKVKQEKAEKKKYDKEVLKPKRISRERARAGIMRHYKNKNTSKQMELLVTQMLSQFITELKGRPLVAYDVNDKESRTIRKEQLGIINQTIVTIRQMREMAQVLADDETEGKTENLATPENVIMMDEAKELLKKAGVKVSI